MRKFFYKTFVSDVIVIVKNGTGDGNVLDKEQNKRDATVLQLRTPRTERNGKTVLLLRTERKENGTIKKEEEERNNLGEGPRSRTERF